ncbi:MAG TPA: hypothetical protein VHL78_03025, partial [Actinomycetota bacterium]|nr:hypothetical protein [Actinomycetota bacterium]
MILWAMMAPLGALMYQGVRAAGFWLAAYLAVVAASLGLEAVVPSRVAAIPEPVIAAFFTLNIAGLS